jgi:hypothetical protein
LLLFATSPFAIVDTTVGQERGNHEKWILPSLPLAMIHCRLMTEFLHGNIVSNAELVRLDIRPSWILDSVDRSTKGISGLM